MVEEAQPISEEMTDETVEAEKTVDEIKDTNNPTEDQQISPQGPDYLGMMLSSGIAPFEIRYAQINSAYRRLPIAYRSFTYIKSITEGVISPDKYSFAADSSEEGMRLAKYNIVQAINAVRRFEEAGRTVKFITARCPSRLALEPDLYKWVHDIFEEQDFQSNDKICLEFPESILYEDVEKVRLSMLNMKLLKVHTMMTGCGSVNCPLSCLFNIPVEFVLLDPMITVMTDNRSKSNSVISLLECLRALPVEIIGDGVSNDSQISALSHADCFGYIPAPNYEGSVKHGHLRMTLDEAVSQNEEETL